MASSTSSLLKLELQTTGENSSTWGTKLNNVISEAEKAVTGEVSVSMAGSSNVTLTDVDFNDSQSRYAVLRFTGAITASVKAIVPARVKWFYAINACTQADPHQYVLSVGTASGTAVAIPAHGRPVMVYCDGTNCSAPQAALPSAHVATSTDTALSTTIAQLNFASGDVVSDDYGMMDHANNKLVIPAGVELVMVQLNIFTGIQDDTTALSASIYTIGWGGSPASSSLPGYWEGSTLSARANGNLKTATVSALIYTPLENHATVVGYGTRSRNITFGAKVGSGSHTCYGHTIDVAVLK